MNLRNSFLAAAMLLPATAPHVWAADASCAAVLKAVQAGMAQPRIHAAIDAPLDAEAIKLGVKKTLMHSIVIDKLQYSNALDPKFQRVALANADERRGIQGLTIEHPRNQHDQRLPHPRPDRIGDADRDSPERQA